MITVLMIAITTLPPSYTAVARVLPAEEARIVERVARQYRLTAEETALMAAIRRAENGRVWYPSLAFGVVDRRARRSYEAQAQWCAGTIAKRKPLADLATFAARWTGRDAATAANWLRNVRWFLCRQGVRR